MLNYFFYLACFLPVFIFSDDRFRLIHADVLENVMVDDASVQFLNGNVKFAKGSMTITCDRAQFREKSGYGSMVGKTFVIKDDVTLTCDSLHFNSPKDLIKAFGNAHIWDEEYDLRSGMLNYYSELKKGEASGNAILRQKNQTIEAVRLNYEKKDEDGVSFEAIENVKIQESDKVAVCGKAIYSEEIETTHLYGEPKIEMENQTLSGSEIILKYKNEELEKLFIPEEANIVNLTSGWLDSDSTKESSMKDRIELANNMSSKILRGFFVDGKMDSLRMEGMATSLYHIFEDSVYQGNNFSSGDTMIVHFEDAELQSIDIFGGGRGIFSPDSLNTQVVAPIEYQSQIIDYNLKNKETDLYSEAQIQYADMVLKAGMVNVNWRSNFLNAFPLNIDSSQSFESRPMLKEADKEPMYGDEMTYNISNRHGKIVRGKTDTKDGYYQGEEIRNQNDDIFYVKNSIYSSCDLDMPHFHFGGQKMKMIHDDKIVSKPLILYIGGIPIFPLPFAIFPHQSGNRNSGWIMPSYGETSNRGQFLDGLGYYWAHNNYSDTKLTTSFADRQGFFVKLFSRYKKRYWFTGNFQFETRQNFSSLLEKADKDISQLNELDHTTDYNVRWSHNQTLRNDQTIRIDASYYSRGDFNRETGVDLAQRLDQQAISRATYSKRWKKSNNSLSMNFQLNQDLMAKTKIVLPTEINPNPFYVKPNSSNQLNIYSGTLPSISFRHGQSQLFPTNLLKKRWYHNISWNYSSNLTNKLRTYYETNEASDSSQFYWNENDTTVYDGILNHNFSLSAPQKILRYITVSPRLSIKSSWVNKYFDAYIDSEDSLLKIIEKSGEIAMRTTGSMSVSIRTQLYGLFPIHFSGLKSIRHVMTPSLGYSFTPDFSKPLFGKDLGYVQTLMYPDGTMAEPHDRFRGTLAGGTPQIERQSMNISVNNVFQAKINSQGEEKKIDLLNWRMSTGYNFVADKFQLANLQSSLRTKIANKLALDIRMTHDFYEYQPGVGRINVFNKSDAGIIMPRLVNTRFSTGFSFSGKRNGNRGKPVLDFTNDSTRDVSSLMDEYDTIPAFQSQSSTPEGNLWKTSVSLNYSYNNANPLNALKSFWLNTNTSIQATKNWRINYQARFDLESRDLVSHSFSIYRDLHCWEMSINWTPSGYTRGIYLKINVKSPTLKDLKFEKRGGIFQNRSNF